MADQSYCDGCGQIDDHPKHVIWTGTRQVPDWEGNVQVEYHPQDTNRDGYLSFHYDCDEQNPYSHESDQKAVELAKSGVHGDELRTAIKLHHEGVN